MLQAYTLLYFLTASQQVPRGSKKVPRGTSQVRNSQGLDRQPLYR